MKRCLGRTGRNKENWKNKLRIWEVTRRNGI
jgi:hypothetical protein